jgi:hypothetical protein
MSHQKLNFGSNARGDGVASKSVDKAGASGAPAQNGSNYNVNKVNVGASNQQYVSINSKDANGIGNVPGGSAMKEKRLSQ